MTFNLTLTVLLATGTLILVTGTSLGFLLGVRYCRASKETQMAALRLMVAGLVICLYAFNQVAFMTGLTSVGPSWFASGMAAMVVAALFPRSFVKVGRNGISFGASGSTPGTEPPSDTVGSSSPRSGSLQS